VNLSACAIEFCLFEALAQPSTVTTWRGRINENVVPFARPHLTFAVTDAVPAIVNVHVLLVLLPLERAPDQVASRPFETLSVIAAPVVNDPDPAPPTASLLLSSGDDVFCWSPSGDARANKRREHEMILRPDR
jgi:hypothetical protein